MIGGWKKSGIYIIINLINKKFYIGCAVNLSQRWSSHKWALNKNRHGSPKLQATWNKYGAHNFEFVILQIVEDKNKLMEIEAEWIEWLKSTERNIGCNSCKIGFSRLGIKRSKSTALKLALSNNIGKLRRKLDKWPHEDGCKCKCTECWNKTKANTDIWKKKVIIFEDVFMDGKIRRRYVKQR